MDFIFLLGDNYGHTYFREKTVDPLIKGNDYFFEQVKEKLKDKIIIPVLGNHESDPLSFFDFSDKENFTVTRILKHYRKFIS